MAGFEFNPNDLHRLSRLRLALRRLPMEARSGGHRTRHSGDSLEFLDYRPYMAGDDFRQIDWTMYGRHRQLFVRRREMPRELGVHFLVDTSRSMRFGSPQSKLLLAQRLVCGLGFVALKGGDRVTVDSFADEFNNGVGPLSGVGAMASITRLMGQLPTGQNSRLLAAVGAMRMRRRHRGLIVVLSDFLNVDQMDQAAALVESGGGRLLLVQVLDDLDRGIGIGGGPVRLRDSESGAMVDVRISESVLRDYQVEFERRRQLLEDHCRQRNRSYLPASTRDNYLELICDALRLRAVLQ